MNDITVNPSDTFVLVIKYRSTLVTESCMCFTIQNFWVEIFDTQQRSATKLGSYVSL